MANAASPVAVPNRSQVLVGGITTHRGFLTMTTDPYGGGEKTYAQSGVEWIAGPNTVATDIWQFPTFPDMTDDGNEAVGKLITGIGEHCEKQIPILMLSLIHISEPTRPC